MRASFFFCVCVAFVCASCATMTASTMPMTEEPPEAAMTNDVHSYALPDVARVTHVSLDLRLDFAARVVAGTAALTIERAAGATDVVLDDRGLVIEGVTDDDGHDLAFVVGPVSAVRGSSLTIALPASPLSKVTIRYRTRPDAEALQWLPRELTASKQQPFFFTQGQAILTRTWIPLQDSPGIRLTYDARIRVPQGITAVMSAERVDEGTAGDDVVFAFDMPQAIPGYLIALAAGDLKFTAISARTGVWADATVVDAAASEFADTEKMVAAAEELYGPYRWGRFDILVLPPSFPFGGMENPRLTFASSTVLAGDRSLVSLIAHELAHSWSGNLVTNATWADIWLNEGTTVYFEDRIVERLYGTDVAEMLRTLAWQDLLRSLAEKDGPDPRLWRALAAEEDPDEALSDVAYIKGAAFLRHLDGVVGRDRFDAFLSGWFNDNAFSSRTTAVFLERVRTQLAKNDDERARMHIDDWAYAPSTPPTTQPTSKLLAQLDSDVVKLQNGAAPSSVDTQSFHAMQWVHLLQQLPRTQTAAQMKALDDAWGLNADHSKTSNNEVRFEWLRLVIANHDERSLPVLENYLVTIGRRKLVLPLYEQLATTSWGREFAGRAFERARPGYHPLTIAGVEQTLAEALSEKPTSP